MSTPDELGLDAIATQARLVAKLRAAKADGDEAWERVRPEPEREPDEEPPPAFACRTCDNPDLGPRYCGTDTCAICGEAIARHASTWWHCHGGRDHMPRPALTPMEEG